MDISEKKTQNITSASSEHPEELDKFVTDIRNFISYSDGMYHFAIPVNCRKYIYEIYSIFASNKTDNEKKRLKAELNGKYNSTNKGDVIWRISIPADKISSYIHFGESFIPYAFSENDSDYEPTEEQMASAISFLNELSQ